MILLLVIFCLSTSAFAQADGKKKKMLIGVHMNEQSRRGIFAASDSDRDGYVSEAEYVHNRIITDEAKEIFYRMDSNRDNRLTEKEMIAGGHFKDEKLAKAVFTALDINGDGRLIIPEYLRVWGGWART